MPSKPCSRVCALCRRCALRRDLKLPCWWCRRCRQPVPSGCLALFRVALEGPEGKQPDPGALECA
jgi:hypothetical protein